MNSGHLKEVQPDDGQPKVSAIDSTYDGVLVMMISSKRQG